MRAKSLVRVVVVALAPGCLAGEVAAQGVYETSLMPDCALRGVCPRTTYLHVRPNGTVYWATIDGMTERDTTDTHFRSMPGLANSSCVSWESVLYPGHFLRHGGPHGELVVQRAGFGDFNFNGDATFCPSGSEWYSYNGPGWYLRKNGSLLVLSNSWSSDRSIHQASRATIGMYDAGTPLFRPAGSLDLIFEGRGWCTGLTPPGTPTRYSCTEPVVPLTDRPYWDNPTQTRWMFNCSASTNWFGTQPWIRMYKRDLENFYKVETGFSICY